MIPTTAPMNGTWLPAPDLYGICSTSSLEMSVIAMDAGRFSRLRILIRFLKNRVSLVAR